MARSHPPSPRRSFHLTTWNLIHHTEVSLFPTTREFRDTSVTGRRSKPFISSTEHPGGRTEITVHQEGHGGRKLPASGSSRTVIGGLASSEFPTILAARREM